MKILVTLLLAIAMIAFQPSKADENMQCSKALGERHRAALETTYKGWRLLTLGDLNPDDQSIWTKARGKQCPSVTEGKFIPDSNSVAVLLISSNEKRREVRVVVAHELKNGEVSLKSVLQEKVTKAPVIRRAGPGQYKGFGGANTVRISTDAIIYEHLESRVILLYYAKSGFKRLVVSD